MYYNFSQWPPFNAFFNFILFCAQYAVNSGFAIGLTIKEKRICKGNCTVREVLVKNCTRVWRNIRNSASAEHERYYEYFAKHKCNFSLILREQMQFPFNIIFYDKKIYFEKIFSWFQ